MIDRMDGLRSDASGFVSHVCPACDRRFKVPLLPGGFPKLAHCPYCEHEGDNYFTSEQKKYLEVLAARLAITTLKTGARMPSLPAVPVERDDDLAAIATFGCCDGKIRHDGGTNALFCPFCGKADAAS